MNRIFVQQILDIYNFCPAINCQNVLMETKQFISVECNHHFLHAILINILFIECNISRVQNIKLANV